MTARELDRIFRRILLGCVPGAAAAAALAQAEAAAPVGAVDGGMPDAGSVVRGEAPPFPSDGVCFGLGSLELRDARFTRRRSVPASHADIVHLRKHADPAECSRLCGVGPSPTHHRLPEGRTTLIEWSVASCEADPAKDVVSCTDTGIPRVPCVQIGRRTAGLATPFHHAPDALSLRLAEMAHLEAASIPAFRRLRQELAHHGAPRPLLDGCSRALRDEIRHARTMARLAKARGARVPRVVVRPVPPRSLAEVALENAVEGCVRETFGALLALHQSVAAEPEFRPVFRRMAQDEARHAALGWRIRRWAEPKLSATERRRQRKAVAEAVEELGNGIPDEADARLGLPTQAAMPALLDACRRALWEKSRSRATRDR